MQWRKRLISLLLAVVGLICLLNMIDLPYQIRFIQAQYDYLFWGLSYVALACLLILRLLLIEDVYNRRTLLVLASMLVVFPCLFVFSISLQHYYRVRDAAGVDTHLMLIHETRKNSIFIREYSMRDQGFAETYGLKIGSKTERAYRISHASQVYFPTKKIITQEHNLGKYFKVVRLIKS